MLHEAYTMLRRVSFCGMQVAVGKNLTENTCNETFRMRLVPLVKRENRVQALGSERNYSWSLARTTSHNQPARRIADRSF